MAVGGNLVTSVDLRQFKSLSHFKDVQAPWSLQMVWLIWAQQMCFRNEQRWIHLRINLQHRGAMILHSMEFGTHTLCIVLHQLTFSQPRTIHFHLWPLYVPVLFHLWSLARVTLSVCDSLPTKTRLKAWMLLKRRFWFFIRNILHFYQTNNC